MPEPFICVAELDPHAASDAEQRALNALDNRLHAERYSGDPPRSVAETISGWRFVPSYLDIHQWAAWTADRAQAVARGWIGIMRTEDNRHMAEFDMGVLPEFRRQGIARRFLRRIAEVAQREGRSLLYCSTDHAVPGGRALLRRLGAQKGLVTLTNQLDMAQLNHELVAEWRQKGAADAGGDFFLEFWEGPYPAADLRNMQRVKDMINHAPKGDLDVEEFHWTREQLRQEEQSLLLRGLARWTLCARHLKSGDIAGFTEVFWNPRRPELLRQGDTAILPRYRSRGLGLWLKTEMLARIVAERPQVRLVRANNAASNAAMLRINRRLGFKPYKAWTTWQLSLAQLQRYLSGEDSAAPALVRA